MTNDELRKRLLEMSPEDKAKFKAKFHWEPSVPDDTIIQEFIGNESRYSLICAYFGVPTQTERYGEASIESARYAKLAFWAAVVSIVVSIISLVVSLRA